MNPLQTSWARRLEKGMNTPLSIGNRLKSYYLQSQAALVANLPVETCPVATR